MAVNALLSGLGICSSVLPFPVHFRSRGQNGSPVPLYIRSDLRNGASFLRSDLRNGWTEERGSVPEVGTEERRWTDFAKIVLFGKKILLSQNLLKRTEKERKKNKKEQKRTKKNGKEQKRWGKKCEGQQNKNYLHCYTVPLMLYIYFIFFVSPCQCQIQQENFNV